MRSRNKLSLAHQAAALKGRFPGTRVYRDRSSLTWRAPLQPTPLSREYDVRISYKLGEHPRVRVISDLATRPGERLPHVYRDGTLCLYMPGEWTPDKFIADSIVTWTCEWLLHYELWLACGEWLGSGEELDQYSEIDRTSDRG